MTWTYVEIDRLAPFFLCSGLSAFWALCLVLYFLIRLVPRGLGLEELASAEAVLLERHDAPFSEQQRSSVPAAERAEAEESRGDAVPVQPELEARATDNAAAVPCTIS